ncbi:efflux transporter outer membrane subunit [Rhodoplanes sp. TEM]|uniref:Efflux transporter outer membrane subunit n=1 Tax=Rhodoplanes tepidamans TaxID=200616 RepID=A0ABT5J7J6_RHOTP|nr:MULTISPECIES: efflux transporter outer membrane subunit [Rhodoplanes]MDC7785269.1 efflux transporter outer membrane subunit [Rhodoplanes tepidamans]MDC7984664.1 efflux transporter outer membrane subunit [Rhodoplanes sp. TEM]MDQ0353527.1 NodT family efflux transporter outer membrane factor (OMF) lipoprotein [Rhodoplanes tepidamans]
MTSRLPRRRPGRAATVVSCTLAAAMLAGCAVGPDYRAPELALPLHWANAPKQKPAAPRDLVRWWQGLRDRTLDSLMDEAVAGNLDVANAKARIREARANRKQSIAALFPTLDGSGSLTRNRTGNSAPSDTAPVSGSPYTLYQAGFDASFELDIFGANKRSLEASTRALEASFDDLDSTLLTLLGDVASYYTEARGYQARIALAKRTAASQRETAALTKSKFDAGSASAVDVAKAVAQAASTEANIPQLTAAYAEAVHRLGILLGREPTALSARMDRAAPIPAPRLPLKAGIPADVLFRRPDVRRAERQLAQYTAKIGVAEAALYPSVSLTGSISTSAQKAGDLGKGSTIGWSWGPSATVPIFNAGSLLAAVEAAEAQRDQYLLTFRSTVLTALEDVENALVSLSEERKRERKLAESAKNYGEAARLSRSLYQTGTSSFLDVLDAERSAYSAEDSLLQSRVAITTDWIALAKALGGGWDRPVDVSKPEVVDTGTLPHLIDVRVMDPAR